MKYTQNISTFTHEVKQSKFIAHLLPYNLYESTLKSLKQKHPKARHFVRAFRYLNEYEQIVEHSSDDGEPKGTSGKPSLMVLQGQELINTAVIIVRYFGGTKLGTGGLVRAYSDAINLVLEETQLIEYQKKVQIQISFEYSSVRLVDYECQENKIDIMEKRFENKVIYTLEASEKDMSILLQKIDRSIQKINP